MVNRLTTWLSKVSSLRAGRGGEDEESEGLEGLKQLAQEAAQPSTSTPMKSQPKMVLTAALKAGEVEVLPVAS